MKTLQKAFKKSQITLEKIKGLIEHAIMENSTWINLGVKDDEVEKVEKLLKDIEKELGNIIASSIQVTPSNLFNEGATSFLEESIQVAFYDLNKIYNDLKNIKKSNRANSDQKENVKSIETHFNQFINDHQKIKTRLEHVLVGKNNNYKIKTRRRKNVRHN